MFKSQDLKMGVKLTKKKEKKNKEDGRDVIVSRWNPQRKKLKRWTVSSGETEVDL
jgi:hypothetical protein